MGSNCSLVETAATVPAEQSWSPTTAAWQLTRCRHCKDPGDNSDEELPHPRSSKSSDQTAAPKSALHIKGDPSDDVANDVAREGYENATTKEEYPHVFGDEEEELPLSPILPGSLLKDVPSPSVTEPTAYGVSRSVEELEELLELASQTGGNNVENDGDVDAKDDASSEQWRPATNAELQTRILLKGLKVERGHIKMGNVLCNTNKSTVHKALWNGSPVVVKLLKTDLIEKTDEESEDTKRISVSEMLHEIDLMSTVLKHPNLVTLLAANLDGQFPLIVTEFMDVGDVETLMQNRRETSLFGTWKPSSKVAMHWSTSVANALSFMHGLERPIIHRDLKPLNLLISKNMDLKVGDFGISKVMPPKDGTPAPKMSGGVGTWRYMAPEVVRYQKYTDRMDVYCWSLITYFIFSGRQPFDTFCKNDPELILKAFIRGEEPRPVLDRRVGTEELRQLLQDAWHVDACQRPSAQECVDRLAAIPEPPRKGVLAMMNPWSP